MSVHRGMDKTNIKYHLKYGMIVEDRGVWSAMQFTGVVKNYRLTDKTIYGYQKGTEGINTLGAGISRFKLVFIKQIIIRDLLYTQDYINVL